MFQSRDYAKLHLQFIGCACCGHESYEVSTLGDRYNFGLQTVVCEHCGLIFTNPRPPDEWFDEFYKYYYRLFYKSLPEPTVEFINSDWIYGRHQRNIELISGYLASKEGTLLDIGASEGTFIHLFQQKLSSWKTFGVEPSESFARFAQDYYKLTTISNMRIQDLDQWEGVSADLITANHVLEHLLDPNFLFTTARRLLRTNGYLFVDVPDAEAKLRGIETLHIAHLYHFSENTLRQFFDKHGFDVIAMERWPKQMPFTIQMIGRKRETTPTNWKAVGLDAKKIAGSFAFNSQDNLIYLLKTWMYRKMYKPIRKLIREWNKPSIQ